MSDLFPIINRNFALSLLFWCGSDQVCIQKEEKKQKEADALFAYSMKNPTAATKKKVK